MTLFEPRVALASLSGRSDADWARAGSEHAGCSFLGGIALDEATRDAARELVERDREEFLPDDPVAFVDRELRKLSEYSIRAGFNVRSTTTTPIASAAEVCREQDAILEINAHCRQDEMCDAGTGETLLLETDRLCEQVAVAADTGARVSVKVRAEVAGVDLPEVAKLVESAGADAIHVDAMDSESIVSDVAEATDLFVIGNNEVRDAASARQYLRYGADAVSVGRASDDPAVLRRVSNATERWFQEAPA